MLGLDVERNIKIHHVKRLFRASFLLGRDLRHPGVNVQAEEMLGKVGTRDAGKGGYQGMLKKVGTRGCWGRWAARSSPASGGSLRHWGKYVIYPQMYII